MSIPSGIISPSRGAWSGSKRPTISRSPIFSTAWVSAPVGSTTSTGAVSIASAGFCAFRFGS